tara:strand:+ start:71 stop:268 length:198 start_codon:yes stop_codon:yes gene_type:complete
MTEYFYNLADFNPGDRVQSHPATDAWMAGDRYGNVTKVGRKYVSVKLDTSGRTKRFPVDLIGLVA